MRRFAILIYGLTISVLLCAAFSVDAAPVGFVATLTGPAEVPPTPSPGTGTAHVNFDVVAHTLEVEVTFQGLISPTIASHIHCCLPPPPATQVAPVATTLPTFPGFPLGVTSGSYHQTFDTTLASTYNPAFITAHGGTPGSAEADLFAGMVAGLTYLNIHTSQFPGGEIRGTLLATPEPGTLLLLAAGIAGLARRLRRNRFVN